MTDSELLLAISQIMDKKIKPLEDRLTRIEVDLLENNVIPRLNNIESCYTSTYNRYRDGVDEIQSLKSDVTILKKVVQEHADKLQKIS